MYIKIIIVLFVIFAFSRVLIRYRKEEITLRETIIWFIFWSLVTAATLWHKTTDIIARYVGVGRGADLLVYISVIVLFFLVFKIIVKLEKIERDITKIVRKVALDELSSHPSEHSEESRRELKNF